MSSPARGARSTASKVLVATAAAFAVIALTRFSPSFSSLGPRHALFGWLGYVTLITACIPAAATTLVQPRPLSAWGLSWGRARRDAVWIALGLAGSVALAWAVSRAPEVRAYYPRYALVKTEPLLWIPSTLLFAAYGLAWETMFRGHLLLALGEAPLPSRRAAALLALQTALFAIAHLDKPPLEAWLSIPAGLFFGLLALRTRSVLPGFLLHFAVSTSVNLFCAYA